MSKTGRHSCLFSAIPLFAALLCLAASLVAAPAAHAARGQVNVRSAVLMDARTGKILYEQNADMRIPPASLTKVMSMLVALDAVRSGRVSLTDTVRVSRTAAGQGGSRMGLRAGERVSLNRLLMGMAVSSGNDASMAVAEHVGGSGKSFIAMMNSKGQQLGMSSSRFRTPNGLPAKGQLTSARDMARLGYVYLKNHPAALRYHRTKMLRHNGMITTNKNPLLGVCPGADGLKTGWISASGYNIISTVRRGNTRLIAVVLGADSPSQRSHEIRKLIEAGFKAERQGTSVSAALGGGSYANQKIRHRRSVPQQRTTIQASRSTGRRS